METHNFSSNPSKKMTLFFFLLLTISPSTISARLLDEQLSTATNSLEAFNPTADPAAPLSPVQPTSGFPSSDFATVTSANSDHQHTLTFFMHDILGGSNPTARAVTGVVNNPAISGSLPFAKPNGANLPLNNGLPQNNGNDGFLNNNNIPFLSGLGGSTSTSSVVQNNNGGNNNGGFAVFSGGQLPQGATLQELMFGTMTVIDDELTEGPELGSGFVGKAQGFYVASSEEGTSQVLAFTAMFESENYADSICFFGIHRIAVSQSQIAIMGGTGKYVNAQGFAIVKTFSAANQHETDGVETLLEFTVHLTY